MCVHVSSFSALFYQTKKKKKERKQVPRDKYTMDSKIARRGNKKRRYAYIQQEFFSHVSLFFIRINSKGFLSLFSFSSLFTIFNTIISCFFFSFTSFLKCELIFSSPCILFMLYKMNKKQKEKKKLCVRTDNGRIIHWY